MKPDQTNCYTMKDESADILLPLMLLVANSTIQNDTKSWKITENLTCWYLPDLTIQNVTKKLENN